MSGPTRGKVHKAADIFPEEDLVPQQNQMAAMEGARA
jgi:hypothetical protein